MCQPGEVRLDSAFPPVPGFIDVSKRLEWAGAKVSRFSILVENAEDPNMTWKRLREDVTIEDDIVRNMLELGGAIVGHSTIDLFDGNTPTAYLICTSLPLTTVGEIMQAGGQNGTCERHGFMTLRQRGAMPTVHYSTQSLDASSVEIGSPASVSIGSNFLKKHRVRAVRERMTTWNVPWSRENLDLSVSGISADLPETFSTDEGLFMLKSTMHTGTMNTVSDSPTRAVSSSMPFATYVVIFSDDPPYTVRSMFDISISKTVVRKSAETGLYELLSLHPQDLENRTARLSFHSEIAPTFLNLEKSRKHMQYYVDDYHFVEERGSSLHLTETEIVRLAKSDSSLLSVESELLRFVMSYLELRHFCSTYERSFDYSSIVSSLTPDFFEMRALDNAPALSVAKHVKYGYNYASARTMLAGHVGALRNCSVYSSLNQYRDEFIASLADITLYTETFQTITNVWDSVLWGLDRLLIQDFLSKSSHIQRRLRICVGRQLLYLPILSLHIDPKELYVPSSIMNAVSAGREMEQICAAIRRNAGVNLYTRYNLMTSKAGDWILEHIVKRGQRIPASQRPTQTSDICVFENALFKSLSNVGHDHQPTFDHLTFAMVQLAYQNTLLDLGISDTRSIQFDTAGNPMFLDRTTHRYTRLTDKEVVFTEEVRAMFSPRSLAQYSTQRIIVCGNFKIAPEHLRPADAATAAEYKATFLYVPAFDGREEELLLIADYKAFPGYAMNATDHTAISAAADKIVPSRPARQSVFRWSFPPFLFETSGRHRREVLGRYEMAGGEHNFMLIPLSRKEEADVAAMIESEDTPCYICGNAVSSLQELKDLPLGKVPGCGNIIHCHCMQYCIVGQVVNQAARNVVVSCPFCRDKLDVMRVNGTNQVVRRAAPVDGSGFKHRPNRNKKR